MIALIFLILGFNDQTKLKDQPKATNDDYELVLTKFKTVSNKLFDIESWKQFEIISKKNGQKNKFSILNNIEKKTFIIMLSQQITVDMAKMQSGWEHELDLYKNPEYKSDNPKVSKPKDIEEFIRKLLIIRKKHAENIEKFTDEFVEEFKTEITEPEAKVMVNKIKQFHDSFNLVERKKR